MDRPKFAQGQIILPKGNELFGLNPQLMFCHSLAKITRQVEINMVGRIENGIFFRVGLIGNP